MTLHQDMAGTLEAYASVLTNNLKAAGFEGATLTDAEILTIVSEAPQSMVWIAAKRGVSKQAVQAQVKSLTRRGLVAIKTDKTDARLRLVAPSEKGRQFLAALSEVQLDLDARIEAKLGTERLKNFRNMLGQVSSVLS